MYREDRHDFFGHWGILSCLYNSFQKDAQILDSIFKQKNTQCAANLLKQFSGIFRSKAPIFASQTKGAWTLCFDAYFGDTSFSKKFLPKIPPEIMERSSAFGISRYRVTEEYLP